jgi:hypothetical protein
MGLAVKIVSQNSPRAVHQLEVDTWVSAYLPYHDGSPDVPRVAGYATVLRGFAVRGGRITSIGESQWLSCPRRAPAGNSALWTLT